MDFIMIYYLTFVGSFDQQNINGINFKNAVLFIKTWNENRFDSLTK